MIKKEGTTCAHSSLSLSLLSKNYYIIFSATRVRRVCRELSRFNLPLLSLTLSVVFKQRTSITVEDVSASLTCGCIRNRVTESIFLNALPSSFSKSHRKGNIIITRTRSYCLLY